MTVIIAVQDEAGVVIGADSRISFGWSSAAPGAQQKVFEGRSGGRPFYIGVSGYSRLMDIARYAVIPDDLNPARDEHQWAVTSLVPALRAACEAAGWTRKEESRETNSSSLLLVVGKRIMQVASDWAVFEPAQRYYAVGSGSQVATGALAALFAAAPSLPAEAKALTALEAACTHDSGCGAPLVVRRCTP